MRSEASSDVLKVWLYAAASVLLGAWFAPLLYNAGKALAEVSSSKQTNGMLELIAGFCRNANFSVFFEWSMLLVAGLLLMPLTAALRGGRAIESHTNSALHLQERAVEGQRLLPNPHWLRQWLIGFLMMSVCFLLINVALFFAGIFAWGNPNERLVTLVWRGFILAFASATFQEILFRGIAMGIFLRAMRPSAALGLSSLLYATMHFLQVPPGLSVVDPDAAGVGFEMLWKIAERFADGRSVLGTFVPLLASGFIFAHARWRTASLWLPIGLHAGWIFSSNLLGSVTIVAGRQGVNPWEISAISIRQGMVILFGIILVGLITNHLTKDSHVSIDRDD